MRVIKKRKKSEGNSQVLKKIPMLYSKHLLFLFLSFFFFSSDANSDPGKVGAVTGLPVPRFVVIKSKEANMRMGPGIGNPTKINYRCMFMPVEIRAEFENWRLVRDIEGNEGWIHEAMLDGRRYVQVSRGSKTPDEEVLMFRLPDKRSAPLGRTEHGAIARLIRCQSGWCQIIFSRSYKGWVPKEKLWGVYPEE